MAGTFSEAMSDTESDFARCVRPMLANMFNGELVPVEGDGNDALKMLDMHCGIDYLLKMEPSNIVYGVASRIQEIDANTKPWNTFTVRKTRQSGASTEFSKRVRDVMCGGIYPTITYQAYVSNGRLRSLAICMTAELLEFIICRRPEIKHTNGDQVGQASFYVCKWQDMSDHGCKMSMYFDKTNSIYRFEHGRLIGTTQLDASNA